jgi:hypothetical protein
VPVRSVSECRYGPGVAYRGNSYFGGYGFAGGYDFGGGYAVQKTRHGYRPRMTVVPRMGGQMVRGMVYTGGYGSGYGYAYSNSQFFGSRAAVMQAERRSRSGGFVSGGYGMAGSGYGMAGYGMAYGDGSYGSAIAYRYGIDGHAYARKHHKRMRLRMGQPYFGGANGYGYGNYGGAVISGGAYGFGTQFGNTASYGNGVGYGSAAAYGNSGYCVCYGGY